MRLLAAFAFFLVGASQAHANYYRCHENIYKDGWFRKYEVSGKTWGANIKKHGIISSTWSSTIEKTTASSDPGVTTGNVMSSVQFSSSWGDCSALEMLITKQIRQEYIDQNMTEIKKQVAMGEGHHLDSLAFISGCTGLSAGSWSKALQANTETLYDIQSAPDFAQYLNLVVMADPQLQNSCSIM